MSNVLTFRAILNLDVLVVLPSTGVQFGRDVLFQEIQNLQPQPNTFESTSSFYMISANYPNYINDEQTVCELTLAAQSKLVVSTLDIRSIGDRCPYQLYVNDRTYQHADCAEELWNSSLSPPVEFNNNDGSNIRTVQVAFKKQTQEDKQGKLWLKFQSKRQFLTQPFIRFFITHTAKD